MKTLIMCAMSLILTSCINGMEYEPLSTTKHPYFGNQLRIDGYYYQKVNGVIFDIYFFFSDGVILSVGGEDKNLIDVDKYIFDNFINNNRHQGRVTGWGTFNINNNQLSFERWYPAERPYPAYVRSGHIVNDTTFVITQSYKMLNGQKTQISTEDETYYFRQFSQKPDSINNFVK